MLGKIAQKITRPAMNFAKRVLIFVLSTFIKGNKFFRRTMKNNFNDPF